MAFSLNPEDIFPSSGVSRSRASLQQVEVLASSPAGSQGRGKLLVQHPPTPRAADIQMPTKLGRPRHRGRIIGAAVLLVLVSGAGAALAIWNYNQDAPVRAVERFLTALADGDLETLNGFVHTDSDTSLLTQAVLDASLDLAPIRTIDVTRSEGLVAASFSVGDVDVTRSFDVRRNGDSWLITDALVDIPALPSFAESNARVNGAAVPNQDSVVFPGSYQLSLDSAYFAFSGDAEIVIASASDAAQLDAIKVVPSETGTRAFTELVSAALSDCLAMTGASTPCGIEVDPDQVHGTFTEGSAQRTLRAGDEASLRNLPITQPYGEPMTVRVARGLTVDLTFRSHDRGSQWEYASQNYQLWPQVNFAVEPLQVSWTY